MPDGSLPADDDESDSKGKSPRPDGAAKAAAGGAASSSPDCEAAGSDAPPPQEHTTAQFAEIKYPLPGSGTYTSPAPGCELGPSASNIAHAAGYTIPGWKDKPFPLRTAIASDGTSYVALADFMQLVKVHNRLNAQSMTSNLITDGQKRRQYALRYGSVSGSKRRTPMISLEQAPSYIQSLGPSKPASDAPLRKAP